MKNVYINKNLGRTLTGLLLIAGLGSCTVYSQGQQYPNNTVYNQPNYDNGGYDDDYYDNSNEPEITFNNFYNALSPYGTWMNYGGYGQVWVCSDPNFRPYYSNGSWVNTNMGWSWNSGYNWGWAPFHYGRWGFAANIGWYWVPGYQWAPAWVYWGNAASNYAWAPVGPGMNLSVNISIGSIPGNYWTYMPGRYMGYSNISRYYVPVAQNNVYIRNTTIINNYNTVNNNVRFSRGPRAEDVSKFTGRPVNTVRIVSSNNASSNGRISNGQMSVYRPGRNAGSSNNGFSRGGNTTNNNNGTGRNNPMNNNNGNGSNNTNPGRTNNPVNNDRGGSVNSNNNNGTGTNNPNWNRGNGGTRDSNKRTDNNNADPTKNAPSTGTNNPANNTRQEPTSSNTQTRWGSWNRGTNNRTAQQQPNSNAQNRQPATTTVPQRTTTPTTNFNRGNSQQNVQRAVPQTGNRAATQTRSENFSGGRFSRGSNSGRR